MKELDTTFLLINDEGGLSLSWQYHGRSSYVVSVQIDEHNICKNT